MSFIEFIQFTKPGKKYIKTPYMNNKNIAFIRPIFLFEHSNIIIETNNSNGNVVVIILSPTSAPKESRSIGRIRAATPNTNSMFMILLPRTFPMEIECLFFSAALTEVASSGKEVPNATANSAITIGAIEK